MHRFMTKTAILSLALCGLPVLAFSQDADPKPKGRSVRFLAVGDLPPFRQEVRDGVRYELPPPPGSIPPDEIAVTAGAVDEVPKPARPATVRLQLGKASGQLPVPSGEGILTVRAAAAGNGDAPWLRVTQPPDGDFLVVIWRDTRAKNWDQPRAMVVPDLNPTGKCTLLNVAPASIAVVCDGQKILLPPAKPHQQDLPGGKSVEFHVGTPTTDGTFKRMLSMSIEQRQSEHTLAVLCLSDGLKPRQPLKLTLVKTRAETAP